MDRKIVFPSDVVFFRNLMLERINTLADIGRQAPLARWMETSSTGPIELQYADAKKMGDSAFKAESDYRQNAVQLLALLRTIDLGSAGSIGLGNDLLELLLMQHFNRNSQMLPSAIAGGRAHPGR